MWESVGCLLSLAAFACSAAGHDLVDPLPVRADAQGLEAPEVRALRRSANDCPAAAEGRHAARPPRISLSCVGILSHFFLRAALAYTIKHITYEDENTRFIDIGPVNKARGKLFISAASARISCMSLRDAPFRASF